MTPSGAGSAGSRPVPPPGTAVRDTARDRVGVVVGHEGPDLRLRPLSGGREWNAGPEHVRPLSPAELLRARVAEANARSRQEPAAAERSGTGRGTGRSPGDGTFSGQG